jgi:methylmalonyl-CoA mutase
MTDLERWKTQVAAELAGAPLDKLETRLREGVTIAPLYVDAADARPGEPGAPPFVRGRRAARRRFTIAPRVVLGERAGDAEAVRAQLLDDLRGGADGIVLVVYGAPGQGSGEPDDAAIARALDGADLAILDVAADATWAAASAIAPLAARLGPGAHVGLDPHAAAARPARRAEPRAPALRLADAHARLGALLDARGRATTLLAHGAAFHEGGASATDELGLAAASLVAQLRWLEARGGDAVGAFVRARVVLGAGRYFFVELAKLRAARAVLGRVAEVIGAPTIPRVDVEVGERMLTRWDRHTNLLRVTGATLAAALGGAERISPARFDARLAAGTPLGARLARNTAHVLLEESHVADVVDPAGGAYFVEQLTQALAERAWARLQGVEAIGGLDALVADGRLEAQLAAAHRAVVDTVAKRRAPITGLTEFPLATEPEPGPEAPPRPEAPARAGDADGFEALRDLVSAAANTHVRPRVYLATLGPLAEHQARLGFAENLYGVVGVHCEVDPGVATSDDADVMATEAARLAERFARSGAREVTICGPDARYGAATIAALVRALASRGATRVSLAGRPGARDAELRAAGVDEFVYVGVDVYATLSALVARVLPAGALEAAPATGRGEPS